MATYTVTAAACTSGGHIHITVKKDGVAIKTKSFNKEQLINSEPIEWEDLLVYFLRQEVKKSGATNVAQAKAAVEAASWVF